MPMHSPAVSIIFAAKNEGVSLMLTMESIKVSRTDISYEVIVVDDQSVDCCCEFLYGYRFPEPIHYKKLGGAGVVQARNHGAEMAKGQFIIFCAAQLNVEDYWIDKLIEPIANGSAACMSPGLSENKDPEHIGYGQTLRLPEMTVDWVYEQSPSIEAPILPWACMAINREVFLGLKGFDEGFKTGEAAAVEFSIRMRLLGLKCGIEPDVHLSLVYRTVYPYIPPKDYRAYHLLRLAYIHFNDERLELSRNMIASEEAWREWEAEILRDGVLQQREQYKASRHFDDNWFFERYNCGF